MNDRTTGERKNKAAERLARAAAEIKAAPIRTMIVQHANGTIAGEITPWRDGQWLARRYGPDYKNGSVAVDTEQAAIQHVLGVTPQEKKA